MSIQQPYHHGKVLIMKPDRKLVLNGVLSSNSFLIAMGPMTPLKVMDIIQGMLESEKVKVSTGDIAVICAFRKQVRCRSSKAQTRSYFSTCTHLCS